MLTLPHIALVVVAVAALGARCNVAITGSAEVQLEDRVTKNPRELPSSYYSDARPSQPDENPRETPWGLSRSGRKIPMISSLSSTRTQPEFGARKTPVLRPRKISRARSPVPALTPRKVSPHPGPVARIDGVPVTASREIIIYDSRRLPSPMALTSRKSSAEVSTPHDNPTLSILRIRPVPSAVLRDRSAPSPVLRTRNTSPTVLTPTPVDHQPSDPSPTPPSSSSPISSKRPIPSLSSPIIIKRPPIPRPSSLSSPIVKRPTPRPSSSPIIIKRPSVPMLGPVRILRPESSSPPSSPRIISPFSRSESPFSSPVKTFEISRLDTTPSTSAKEILKASTERHSNPSPPPPSFSTTFAKSMDAAVTSSSASVPRIPSPLRSIPATTSTTTTTEPPSRSIPLFPRPLKRPSPLFLSPATTTTSPRDTITSTPEERVVEDVTEISTTFSPAQDDPTTDTSPTSSRLFKQKEFVSSRTQDREPAVEEAPSSSPSISGRPLKRIPFLTKGRENVPRPDRAQSSAFPLSAPTFPRPLKRIVPLTRGRDTLSEDDTDSSQPSSSSFSPSFPSRTPKRPTSLTSRDRDRDAPEDVPSASQSSSSPVFPRPLKRMPSLTRDRDATPAQNSSSPSSSFKRPLPRLPSFSKEPEEETTTTESSLPSFPSRPKIRPMSLPKPSRDQETPEDRPEPVSSSSSSPTLPRLLPRLPSLSKEPTDAPESSLPSFSSRPLIRQLSLTTEEPKDLDAPQDANITIPSSTSPSFPSPLKRPLAPSFPSTLSTPQRLSSAKMPRVGTLRSENPEFTSSENNSTSTSTSPPFLPRDRFLVKLKREQETKEDNLIGKSPCPRGIEGQTCRRQLALSSRTCTSGSCLKCRRGCSNLSPSEWPTCCRDHLLCCRHLASACLNCDQPQLVPFCSAAFKKCA